MASSKQSQPTALMTINPRSLEMNRTAIPRFPSGLTFLLQPRLHLFSPRRLVTALAVALGVSAGAYAAMPSAGEAPGQRAGMSAEQRMRDLHGLHGLRGIMRLHDELKLDARQEVLWNDAAKSARESMAGTHQRLRQEREETLALLNQPGTDLRTLVRRTDEVHADAQKQHLATREHWLVVYDALSAEQREKVRVFFKDRIERSGEARHAPRARDAQRAAQRG